METLTREHCEACMPGAPRLSEQELADLLPNIPEWRVTERDGVPRLARTFRLKNFEEALALTNRIGALAEEENHHPSIITEWGSVTVAWWTHAVRGLHRNDVIMAAKTDQAAAFA